MKNSEEIKTITDSIAKIGTALTIAAILWVASMIIDQDKKIDSIANNQRFLKENVEKLNLISLRPYFSQRDFDQQILPIIKDIDYNRRSINNTNTRIRDLEKSKTNR